MSTQTRAFALHLSAPHLLLIYLCPVFPTHLEN
jgi:hypothetical protein